MLPIQQGDSLVLARLEAARHLLAEARNVPEVKHVRDVAETLRIYAKQCGASLDIQNAAAEIKLRAERRAGELLAATVPHEGGRPVKKPFHNGSDLRLHDLGINVQQSHRWQQLATLPTPTFETYILETKDRAQELTTAGALKLAREAQQAAAREHRTAAAAAQAQTTTADFYTELSALVATGATFGCLYVDPPWPYANQGTRASTAHHYPTMILDAIAGLPIETLAAPQAHLHLWITNAFLGVFPHLFAAWGFEYKSSFVWVKPELGLGNYWRNSHEFLLLGIRGDLRAQHRGLRSWIEAPRTAHSAKPAMVRDLLTQLSPGPYLELFGRTRIPGWTVWGNEYLPPTKLT